MQILVYVPTVWTNLLSDLQEISTYFDPFEWYLIPSLQNFPNKSGIRQMTPITRLAEVTNTFCLNSNKERFHFRIKKIHWSRVTQICVGKLTIIGSDNGLLPDRRQAIIWTNAGTLLIGPLGINFNEILIGIQTFSFKKIHLKMSSGKWRPFCLGLNVLKAMPLLTAATVVSPVLGVPVKECINDNKLKSFLGFVEPGPRLNIKTVFPRYGDSHVKDKTVGETVLSLTWESLYW